MLVYRLELNGIGPYRNSHLWNVSSMGIDVYSDENHPVPKQEFQNQGYTHKIGETSLFGVDSKERLLQWFPPKVIRVLNRLGYKIAVYDIDVKNHRTYISQNQVVFPRKQKPKRFISINDFFSKG